MKRTTTSAALTLLLLWLTAAAPTPGVPEVIHLWPASKLAPATSPATRPTDSIRERGSAERPDRWTTNISDPTITLYLPAPELANGTAVVICPGGGYGGLSMDREGHEIARFFNCLGVASAVLKYRMPNTAETGEAPPSALQDAQQAIRLLRQNSAEWNLNPHRIGICGFSAGGHLASTAGTHFSTGEGGTGGGLSTRPDFLVLGYPVISLKEGLAHMGSRNAFIGKTPADAQVTLYSNELQVTAQTPPAFLFHAQDDRTVKVENSRLFKEALQKAGVEAELVEFQTGGHGFGLGRGESAAWPAKLTEWLKKQGLLTKAGK